MLRCISEYLYCRIHQVRSYNRNIAVNIWWNSFKNEAIDLEKCDKEFDPTLTLDNVVTTGMDGLESSPEIIRLA